MGNITTEYVTEVIDGDSFKTKENDSEVRLIGVNTPDTNEPGYEKAKKKLEQLILDEKVRIEFIETDPRGRRRSNVKKMDGTSVNDAMKPFDKEVFKG